MKRYFLAFLFICTLALPACQCDEPPDIGPVEDASLATPAPAGRA